MLRSPLLLVLLASSPLLAACSGGGSSTSGSAPPPAPITEVDFPQGFLWGAATAGFQVEKGLGDSDWGVWASEPGKIKPPARPDDGPDAFGHVDGDVALMAGAHLNGYRFSIEMARVYPTRASFDADAPSAAGLALYENLLTVLRSKHIDPLVTLHHFVWPSYLSDPTHPKDPQGWERPDAGTVFGTWCSRMGKRFGAQVDWWVTINEPGVESSVGYLAGLWAPGITDVDRMARVMKAQVDAHARCYDALHAADTVDADGDGKAVLVSIAAHNRVYEPADPTSSADAAAVVHSDHFWNRWYLDAIVHGDVDENFDDVIGPGDRQADPALKGRADYVGLNYYGVSQVSSLAIQLPYMGAFPSQYNLVDGRPKNDLGWSIDPAGFGPILDEAGSYGLPIVVTENGIADATDVNRSRFLLEHAFEIGKAIKRGVDVRGYFHWALMDNFEWASGFCPRFGLYRTDYASPERTRTATKAVPLLQALASSNHLAQADLDKLPAYTDVATQCQSF